MGESGNSGDLALGYMMGTNEGGGGNSGSNNGGLGDFGGIWGILALLLILGGIGGFGGGRGGGLLGGGSGGGDGVSAGFAWQGLDSGIRGIQQGICDSTYALNNSIMSGFHGVDNAICTLGYNVQSGFNTLGYQQKDCCCETQRLIERGFCDLGQSINMQTRDIIDNQNANYRGIMDFMVQSKIDKLQSENQELRLAASQANQNAFITANQEAQTAELIRRLGRDTPVPAYIVQPSTPLNFPTNGCGTIQFGGNYGGCGCGCGCG